jgi:hypothetical protein
VRLYDLGIQKLFGHNLQTRRKKEETTIIFFNSPQQRKHKSAILEIILYDTNPTIIILKDGTGNKETAKLRGTVRIGLGSPVFHPGAPRSLPQLQMPKFHLGFSSDSEHTFSKFFLLFSGSR